MQIARERLRERQLAWDFDMAVTSHDAERATPTAPVVTVTGIGTAQVAGSRSQVLSDVLAGAYARPGFEVLGDDAFRAMVLARTIEPTSKANTIRVLDDVGVPVPSLRTLFRALGRCLERD